MARFNKRILRKLGKDAKEFKIAQDEKLATITEERKESIEKNQKTLQQKNPRLNLGLHQEQNTLMS